MAKIVAANKEESVELDVRVKDHNPAFVIVAEEDIAKVVTVVNELGGELDTGRILLDRNGEVGRILWDRKYVV